MFQGEFHSKSTTSLQIRAGDSTPPGHDFKTPKASNKIILPSWPSNDNDHNDHNDHNDNDDMLSSSLRHSSNVQEDVDPKRSTSLNSAPTRLPSQPALNKTFSDPSAVADSTIPSNNVPQQPWTAALRQKFQKSAPLVGAAATASTTASAAATAAATSSVPSPARTSQDHPNALAATPSTTTPHSYNNPPTLPIPKYFAFWSVLPTPIPLLSHSFTCILLFVLAATRGLLPSLQTIIDAFSLILVRATLFLSASLALLHRTGALRRFAIRFAEKELSKVMNSTLVTVSDIQVDVWRGTVIVRDLIIHNKDRSAWQWESPCLARVGRIEARLNFASVIEIPHYGPILGHTFKDIYTGLVEDVQVFIEKRKNIFNFHLLDPSLAIPDPDLIMEEYWLKRSRRGDPLRKPDGFSLVKSNSADGEETKGSLTKGTNANQTITNQTMANRTSDGIDPDNADEDFQSEANKIVERLVGAVSNLGKAANEGGSKGLQSALRNQREGWVKSLRRLHAQNSSVDLMAQTDPKDSIAKRPPPKPKKDVVTEGMNVMRQLGKVVEKNVSDIKEGVTLLQKPPPKKQGWVSKPADIVRIGSLLVRQMRIFTKDMIVLKSSPNHVGPDGTAVPATFNSSMPFPKGADPTAEGWSRPIVIWELAITSAEFSPPMAARDPHSGMPVVGLPIDRAVDIILKRLLTEMAKTNSGRLFQTAFGDVFAFMDVTGRKGLGGMNSEKRGG